MFKVKVSVYGFKNSNRLDCFNTVNEWELLETTAEFPFNKNKICYFMLEGMGFENKDESI